MVQTTLSSPLCPSCEEWSQASALRTSGPHDRPYRVDAVRASRLASRTWYAASRFNGHLRHGNRGSPARRACAVSDPAHLRRVLNGNADRDADRDARQVPLTLVEAAAARPAPIYFGR